MLQVDNLPTIIDIKEEEALNYVSDMLDKLLKTRQILAPNQCKERRPSYEQAVETKKSVVDNLIPNKHYNVSDAVENDDAEEDFLKAYELYKRFWLKEVPPISIQDYLQRFHRYCKSSPATYLTAGSLIYDVVVEKQVIPITPRNVYRIFCAAFIVAAKFIEDELYPMSRYATTAGLKKHDLSRIETSFLLLINFDIHADKEYLRGELKKWAQLQSEDI